MMSSSHLLLILNQQSKKVLPPPLPAPDHQPPEDQHICKHILQTSGKKARLQPALSLLTA